MSSTQGRLVPARIVEVDEGHSPITSTEVPCMFNPYEYTTSKSNSFTEKRSANGKNAPQAELSKAGAQTLKLNLIFDTYADQSDVSKETDKLWKFMKVSTKPKPNINNKDHVPLVAFHWGVFFFVSYITNMTQKFTLFTKDGIPVRANVDITFTQYADIDDRRNASAVSAASAINQIHRVVGGDRLDIIASNVFKDPSKWRLIAEANKLPDPTSIRPGQMLTIPFENQLLK